MGEKRFPIQAERGMPADSVPWSVAERAYREYSRKFGTSQSLERLAERHGFGWVELCELVAADAAREEPSP